MSTSPVSTLYLLRHAHAAVAVPGQSDHQRPLDSRGRRDAPLMGEAIGRETADIDAVLCSTATRTRETLEAVRQGIGTMASAAFSDALYEGGSEAYFAEVRGFGAGRSLLVIGHNPMMEEFALSLAGDGDAGAMALLREGLPTAGLAIISFGTALSSVAPGSGTLRKLLRPRDLGR